MPLDKNNKIIIFHTYPIDTAPGQRFRYEQYISFLNQYYEIEFRPFMNKRLWSIYYKKGRYLEKAILMMYCFVRRFTHIFNAGNSKIFIFRELSPFGPPFFEFILAKILNKKYILDFDDAIWLPNFSQANSKFQFLKMYWKIDYSIKWAFKITVGNNYLANYTKRINSNVQIIPTTIDTKNYHNILTNHNDKDIVIGWTGTHSTMRYLDFIFPIIEELEKKYDFKFRVISDKAPNIKLKSIEFVKWNKESEIQDLSKIHIGIMPLKEDKWSQGKCGFKGLQYMALGIVAVMSPVGVNNTIVQHGKNGFLVDEKKDWINILSVLLKNQEKRKEIGQNGRKTIEDYYSVEANKKKYLEVFRSLE